MTRWTRFRQLFGPDPEGDVDEEFSFHLDMRARELVDRGESPERARDAALERFGDYERSRRACVEIDERQKRTLARAEYAMEIRQDVAYALRTMRRALGFTAVAVLTLGLGIGATSAIFSVVRGVLAATGVFAVLIYAVAQRAREINIRMVLGAGSGEVVRTVVAGAVVLMATGAAAGLVGALLLGQVIRQQLFGVGVFDPVTVVVVVTVLAASGAAASLAPACRAASLDPASLLR